MPPPIPPSLPGSQWLRAAFSLGSTPAHSIEMRPGSRPWAMSPWRTPKYGWNSRGGPPLLKLLFCSSCRASSPHGVCAEIPRVGRTETATFCPHEVAADDEAEPKTATFCPNEVGADGKTCAENMCGKAVRFAVLRTKLRTKPLMPISISASSVCSHRR